MIEKLKVDVIFNVIKEKLNLLIRKCKTTVDTRNYALIITIQNGKSLASPR